MQTSKITPGLLAKYRVYVKIKHIFLKNLRKKTPKQTMILQNKLLGSVWELKAINDDEGSVLTNSVILDGLDDIVGYKCLIFIDEVKIAKIERMGGKLF